MSSSTKSKFEAWLSNKDVRYMLIILAVAFIIRLYYFIIASGQTMWWDEAEYMSAAKHWALNIPYDLNEQRPPLFQLLGALLIKFGFGEVALKFILVLIPSLTLVVSVYYLGKELYGSTVGLIAATGTAFVWSMLFWSIRFQPDFFSVTFQVLALLFFWKMVKSPARINAVYTGLFVAAGFYFKISALLIPLSMVIFALYQDGLKIFKQKDYWILLGVFVVAMIPFMIWQAVTFGNPIAFGVTYSGDFNEGRSPGWMTLDFYYSFSKLPIFILFIIGLAITLFKTAITADLILKDKSLRKDPYIFSAIVLLVITLFYIFYIRGTIEDRWVFLMIPFIFFFAGKTILIIYDKIKKHSNLFAILFMIILLLAFIIPQLSHTTELVNSKKDSYAPVKEASLLIKENSQPQDKIFSVSYTQTTAYAEREVITYSEMPEENFTQILQKENPRFVIVSILEPHHPQWMLQQVQNEQGFRGILFPYFNSSIIVSPQNQIVQYDLKKQVSQDGAVFSLIYPLDNNFGGLVAYKIDYIT